MTVSADPAPPAALETEAPAAGAPALRLRDRVAAELTVRLVGVRPSDRFWGWVGPLVVMAIGGFLRFWRLGHPRSLVFDETYYAKEGVSLLFFGYERVTGDDKSTPPPDQMFTQGTPNVFSESPDFVVHPPLGKWMIAIGERIFGLTDPFGWRFAGAVCGTLSILMVARIARRMFGSTLLGCAAGLLLAFEGHHLTMSRTSILDIFVMFWALAAFGLLLIDRDVTRKRLARRIAEGADVDAGGPGLGIRWWRIAAGVALGCCCAVKWSGLFYLVAFSLMTVLWDVGARRAVNTRLWALVGLVRDGFSAFVQLVPVAIGAYLLTWIGWFLSDDAYDRDWASAFPSPHAGWIPGALRSLWQYHYEAWDFNVHLTEDHDYQSNPWSWMVMGRPTAFFAEDKGLGQAGCKVDDCVQIITPIGNPVVWWGATLALVVLLFCWALRRDWRAGAILAGFAGGYLPWFRFQERTIFNFYAVAFAPFAVLALTYVLGLMIGPKDASEERRVTGAMVAGTIVAAAVAAGIFFYPVLVADTMPRTSWQARMWLPGWI